jgi:hypothetical protein
MFQTLSFEPLLYSIVVPSYKRVAQRLAKMIFLSATLTKDELKKMIVDLEKMLDKKEFETKDGDPLTLTQSLSQNFHGYNFSTAKNMNQIFTIIERLISTTGKVGDKEMEVLEKSLKEIPDLKTSFKDMEFDVAKHKALRALEALDTIIDELPQRMKRKTLSPTEFEEMKKLKVV